MLCAFKIKKFTATVTFACASLFASVAPVYADQLPAELIEFREDLDQYLVDMIDSTSSLPGTDANVATSLEESRLLIPELTEQELAQMKKAFDRHPAAWEAATAAQNLAGVQKKTQIYLQKQAEKEQMLASFSGEHSHVAGLTEYQDNYDNGCPGATPMGAVIPVGIITLALEGVNDAINDGLVVVIMGQGTSVPNPVKIITSVAFFVSKLTLASMEWARDVSADCEFDDHWSYLRDVVARTQAKFTPKKELTITSEYVKLTVDRGQTYYNFVVFIEEDGKAVDANIAALQASQMTLPISFKSIPFTATKVTTGIYQLVVPEPADLRGIDRLRIHANHADNGVDHFGVGTAKTKKD